MRVVKWKIWTWMKYYGTNTCAFSEGPQMIEHISFLAIFLGCLSKLHYFVDTDLIHIRHIVCIDKT
jgi:hypothetical protein